MWWVMSEKFGCVVRELETGVQLTSSIHLPDVGCFSHSLLLYKLPLHPVWVLKHWVAMVFSRSNGETGQPCSGTSPPSSSEITGLFLPAFLMCSCFLWHGQRRASELDHLLEESWWSSAVHCGWMILGVTHVSEMVRESKCISHLQISQMCHTSADFNSS